MNTYPFQQVPMEYRDLCPELSAFTLSFHYEGHYRKYTETLNSLVEKNNLQNIPIERLVFSRDEEVRFNAGGYYNHSLYFSMLSKKKKTPSEKTANLIERSFGGMDAFVEKFKKAALGVKGSGYVWLCFDGNNLRIGTTANQNTPSLDRMRPLCCIDMWEHAYYLDYQNRKNEYIDAWLRLIDWDKIDI